MTVTEVFGDARTMLMCDECPAQPDWNIPVIVGTGEAPSCYSNWNRSCQHIEEHINSMRDVETGLREKTRYMIPLSPVAAYGMRDPWGMFVFVEVHEAMSNGMMKVTFNYDSDLYTSTNGDLGLILPEDGRASIRAMLWDSVTAILTTRQPRVTTDGLRCPISTHSMVEQQLFSIDCANRDGINAQVACIVFENCCTYCYRKTAGQDQNFGFAPDQPRSNLDRMRGAQRPGTNTAAPAATPAQPLPAPTAPTAPLPSSSTPPRPPTNPDGSTPAPPPWMVPGLNPF